MDIKQEAQMNRTGAYLRNTLLTIVSANPLAAAAFSSNSYVELQPLVGNSHMSWLLLGCVGIMLFFMLLWNRILSRRLARRTAELQQYKQGISAHKATELALEESREQIAIAFEAANLGYWDWRAQSNELYTSEHFPVMLGYSADNFPQTTDYWLSLVHPDDRTPIMTALQPYLNGDDGFLRSEYRIQAANGEWRWILDVGRVVARDAQGKAERIVGVYSDISERKQADSKSSLVQYVLEKSLNEIYLFDMETLRFIDVNLGARQNLGYSMAELATMTPLDIKPEFTAELLNERVAPLVSGVEEKIVFNTLHQRKDGSQYLAEVHLQLMRETPPLFAAIAIDITERHRQQEELHELSTQLQNIAAKVPAMVYQFKLRPDGSSCFPYASAAMLKMFQALPEEAQEDATNIFSVINRDDIDEVGASIAESARTLAPWRQEFRVRDEAGSTRWLFGHSVPDSEPEPDGSIVWHGIVTDITEQKAVQNQQRLAASVFAHSQQSIIITDAENRIIDVNPACLMVTGYSREALLGENPRLFKSSVQDDTFYKDMWRSLKDHGYWQGDIWNRKQSGELFAERLSINTVKNELGVLQHYVAVGSDITYLKKHQADLEQLAFKDSLTGLPNRRLLNDRMHQALVQAKRHNKLIAVCYLDLDGFKAINDNYDHKAGDQVLVETARRLERSAREGDTIARMGGDEFVLLILDLNTVGELKEVIERVLYSLTQPYLLPDVGTVIISASIGIALYPEDKSEVNTLIRHADQAMYTAKRQGKNCYSFFDLTKAQQMNSDQSIQHEIEIALSEQQLQLFYQPMINMRTGEVVGLEALIRWQHPLKGLLTPDTFLPAIKQSPLIVNLGNWVLRQVMMQMRAWKALGVKLKVSVNIAAQQLEQPDFVDSLGGLMNEFSDIPPSCLELEILETAAMYDIGQVSRIMAECLKLGVSFALDDFGTGYSSLTYLKSLPAKVIKIDQSFVSGLLNNHEDIDIIHGILDLAKAFDRTPVAEGVETIEHGVLLLNLGCELAQGYGIARPMPAGDVFSWLRDFQIAPEWLDAQKSDQENQEYSLLLIAAEQHRLISRVLDAIEQQMPSLLPKQTANHCVCEFCRWLTEEGKAFFGHLPEFKHLLAKQQELVELFKQVTELLTGGDCQALSPVSNQLKDIRDQILDSLHQLRSELRQSPLSESDLKKD